MRPSSNAGLHRQPPSVVLRVGAAPVAQVEAPRRLRQGGEGKRGSRVEGRCETVYLVFRDESRSFAQLGRPLSAIVTGHRGAEGALRQRDTVYAKGYRH